MKDGADVLFLGRASITDEEILLFFGQAHLGVGRDLPFKLPRLPQRRHPLARPFESRTRSELYVFRIAMLAA